MKRFTKLLAMGMALAMTFGMTVSATGNNPSEGTSSTKVSMQVPDGIVQENYQGDQWNAVSSAAIDLMEKGALDKIMVGTYVRFSVIDVFGLSVSKAGKVTYTGPSLSGYADDEYGYSWGYALLHLNNNGELVETLPLSKDGNNYSATVKSGSPFALVYWRQDTNAFDENGNPVAGHDVVVDKGVFRSSYQGEHTAARIAIENDGYGTSVAQYYNAQYVFAKTMGSIVLNLEKDSNVQFSGLDDLEQGEAYLVLCYNDVQNISGAPNRHFMMKKVADKTYTADLPKGKYLAVVIKVTTDTTKVPTTQVTVPATGPVAGADAGSQTTVGVVSPKTGEMLPVAVILAAICLAGAAVCAKKARTNA